MRSSPPADRARHPEEAEFEALMRRVDQRVRQGLAPPPEIYRVPIRQKVDWSKLPEWARPVDPEVFEGCGHEG
jgi:hypothetical protein